MCSWFKFPIGFCRVCSLFLGASVMASTLGIPRLTKNWIIPGPLRCIKLSSSVILKPSIHISKTYLKGQVATICFSTAISVPPPQPSCSLEGLPSTHFTNFPICGVSSFRPYPVSTMTIHGLLTVFWFLANYSWFMTPLISWHKRLLSVS